ncbi:MAG: hypothetical protein R8P61_36985 [Bacteroidia bacterium]|nr:hypothetical protein [Bacteroidia bacterium]
MKDLDKNVKRLLLVLAVLFFCNPGFGQNIDGETFSLELSNPNSPGKLEFQNTNGGISIVGHDKATIEIFAKRREKRKAPKTREGMKSISNNNLEYSVEEIKNTVLIRTWNSGTVDFEIKVPRKFSLNIKTVNRGNIYVEKVSGEFEVSNVNGSITMKDVSGSVIADALNKDIIVNFISINNSPMAFSNFNGDIEVSFPGSLQAEVKAKSQTGEIYTDFDMKIKAADPTISKKEANGAYKVTRDEWVRGSINGGGAEIVFQTHNGDILIRNKDK